MPLEYFYTITERIEGDRVRWIEVLRLRRSIESICEQFVGRKTIYRYLFDSLRGDCSLVESHWWAFLQHRGDRVAQPIYTRNRGIIPDYETILYTLLKDPRIARPIDFFREFDGDRPKAEFFYPTLLNWTDRKLKNILYNSLRQHHQTIGRTNLGLVAIYSPTKIRQVLRGSGLDLEESLGLVNCFKEVRSAIAMPIDRWRDEQFLQVIARYQEIQSEGEITLDGLKERLDRIGQEIRNYFDPPTQMVNVSGEDGQQDLWANIPAKTGETDRSSLEIRDIIRAIILSFPEQEQRILELRYNRQMSQAMIEEKLSIDQSKISRRLDSFRKQVYAKILAWNEDKDPNTSSEIKLTSRQRKEIDDYLEHYYLLLAYQ